MYNYRKNVVFLLCWSCVLGQLEMANMTSVVFAIRIICRHIILYMKIILLLRCHS